MPPTLTTFDDKYIPIYTNDGTKKTEFLSLYPNGTILLMVNPPGGTEDGAAIQAVLTNAVFTVNSAQTKPTLHRRQQSHR